MRHHSTTFDEDSILDCFKRLKRAKEGFENVGNHENIVGVGINFAIQTHDADELIRELRELLEKPEEAISENRGHCKRSRGDAEGEGRVRGKNIIARRELFGD